MEIKNVDIWGEKVLSLFTFTSETKNWVVIRHAKGLKVRKYHEEPSPQLIYNALGKDQAR